MTMQNRKTRTVGRAAATAFAALLMATSMFAIGANDAPHRRRQVRREALLQAMDSYAWNYGGVDWSLFGSSAAEPSPDGENARIMSVFLSLGNAYLNRFERRGAGEDLERSLEFFEMVARSEEHWGKRPFAVSVVGYLGISLVRLEAGGAVGQYRGRIEKRKL